MQLTPTQTCRARTSPLGDRLSQDSSARGRHVASAPDAYLAIARVVAPHGIRGEVRCQILTDFPERFARTRRVFAGEEHHSTAVERARVHRGRALLKFVGVDSREAAQGLVGSTLYIPKSEAVTLPPDTYFWHDIIGLTVRSTDGADLGRVTQILETGSNDVYVVQGAREVLIPATRDVVRSIDVAGGLITIELIEGLI